MNRRQNSDADHRQSTAPPGTPPVIDSSADAGDAVALAMDDGDSHAPGSQPAHFDRGREKEAAADGANEGHLLSGGSGDRDFPGEQPDEIVPDQGDTDVPDRTPDEVSPDQGDFDQPDSSPDEVPPQPDSAPFETPPPPD